MVITRREALALPLLMGVSSRSLGRGNGVPVKSLIPEDFGAIGYATSQSAAAGRDATTSVQKMADEAARLGVVCGGKLGCWYKTGSVNWPSGSTVVGLQLTSRAGAEDVTPFNIDALQQPKRNLSFTACAVDGNRRQQHALSSSDGDGQRCGWRLSGGFPDSIVGIKLDRCRAWHCATDGFFTWCNGLSPASRGAYFFRDIEIIDPDFQWNGRHGGSLMGVRGFRLVGGALKNNGKNLPHGSAVPHNNGTWARSMGNTARGRLYGRPWDCESQLLGEGFEDISFTAVDMRNNIGGLLFHHNFAPGYRCARNIRVERCLLSDPMGQTTGDGSLIFYAADPRTGKTLDDGSFAYERIEALNNYYERHGVAAYSGNGIRIVGGRANMTGPGFWGHYAMLINCGDDVIVDVPSNRYHIWLSRDSQEGLIGGRLSNASKPAKPSS